MYRVVSQDGGCFELSFDPTHPIYKAHFPGNPITPGVCLMQIVGDLSSEIVGRKLQMVGARNVKFLSVLNPVATPLATCKLKVEQLANQFEVHAVIEAQNRVIAKIVASYE